MTLVKQSMVDEHAEQNIGVFTGSRAEYGLLKHLIAAIGAEPGRTFN